VDPRLRVGDIDAARALVKNVDGDVELFRDLAARGPLGEIGQQLRVEVAATQRAGLDDPIDTSTEGFDVGRAGLIRHSSILAQRRLALGAR
jgi:hypothetical protein